MPAGTAAGPPVFAIILALTAARRDIFHGGPPMTEPRINGLRSVELGVHDLNKSAEFYRRIWALEDVSGEGDTLYMRGTSRDHHVF